MIYIKRLQLVDEYNNILYDIKNTEANKGLSQAMIYTHKKDKPQKNKFIKTLECLDKELIQIFDKSKRGKLWNKKLK